MIRAKKFLMKFLATSTPLEIEAQRIKDSLGHKT